jgi:predicted MPP superfamily phosphohydrolase
MLSSHIFSRRSFLRITAGAALAGGATFGYARSVEPAWVDVERVDLPLRGLASRLADRTIALLSDIHIGEYTSVEKVAAAIELVNSLAPDWVCITGDFVCSKPDQARSIIEPLRDLDRPAYAVLGNHDVRAGVQVLQKSLAETPVKLLRNKGVLLESDLWLAGLDDAWHGRPDAKASLGDAPPDATALLMVHEPDYFDRLLDLDAPFAAQFSGHTHGGQVRLPRVTPDGQGSLTWAPVLPYMGERYSMGLYQAGGRFIYTNRGIGAWPLPYRVNCRPEITLFSLREA